MTLRLLKRLQEWLADYWGDLTYRDKRIKRYPWRALQILILLAIAGIGLVMYILGISWLMISVTVLVLLVPAGKVLYKLEKQKVEWTGRGPTIFQYLYYLLFGRKILGYTKVPFKKWKSAVDMAKMQFFVPMRELVNNERGHCTWHQYVHYMAGARNLGYGRVPAEYWAAVQKTRM